MCLQAVVCLGQIIEGKGRENEIYRNVGNILANVFQNLNLASARVNEVVNEFIFV